MDDTTSPALAIARMVCDIIEAGRGDELAYLVARDTAAPEPCLTLGQRWLVDELVRRIPAVLVPSRDERRRLAEQVARERDGETTRYAAALDIIESMARDCRRPRRAAG